MAANPPPPADERLFVTEESRLELIWTEHRSKILLGAAILVVVALGVVSWIVTSYNARLAAEAAFAEAATPEAWRKVIADHPGSMPAANASFLLAAALRNEGQIAASNAAYETFLKDFPEHPLAGGARLGLAENFAVEGQTDQALAALRDVQAKDFSSYAGHCAALFEGRILIQQGKLADARRVFANLVSTFPNSPAAQIAGQQLDQIAPLLPAPTATQ